MEIQDITSVNGLSELSTQLRPTQQSSVESFDSYFMNEINNVNNKIINAENNVTNLATGESTNIHEVMLSINEAKLSLQMMMQVRNKTLESLQEILRMQV